VAESGVFVEITLWVLKDPVEGPGCVRGGWDIGPGHGRLSGVSGGGDWSCNEWGGLWMCPFLGVKMMGAEEGWGGEDGVCFDSRKRGEIDLLERRL